MTDPQSAPTGAPPAVAVQGLRKTYGATTAIDGLDLQVRAGTIHAFVGENGAGKSTILGVLAGRLTPTAGTVTAFGAPLRCGSPRASRQAGIVAIYQELTTVPGLSAMANVCLGRPAARYGWVQRHEMKDRFTQLASRVGASIDPSARAGDLSVADQQLLEIMRALHADARLILLDEPTAVLAAAERQALLTLMRGLRESGVTLVFVSHNLEEVLDAADHISVFRDGRLVEEGPAPGWHKPRLVSAMLGDKARSLADAALPAENRAGNGQGPARPLLTVRDLSVPGVLNRISLDVAEGEIVGIGGLVGSGRTTLLRALAGLEPAATGQLVIGQRPVPWTRTTRAAIAAGLALVPEDRKTQGLIPGAAASRNITLSNLQAIARFGWIQRRLERQAASAACRSVALDGQLLARPTRNLSGGNQQKVLLARWVHRRPLVLLLDEPTRGVDIGAKAQILRTLRSFTRDSAGILLVSSEHEELLSVADRILVLSRGRITGEHDNRDRHVSERDILDSAFQMEASS
jgi:ABC-type sugar transport system ATPase subunit